jgi:site-specific DNA-methyltransferase (adenine-specific)
MRFHPSQKPIPLYKWILRLYAKSGDTIFDSHGGSMSSVIACLDGGFDITCCELDKEYFDAAVKRVEIFKQQLKLF